MNWKMNYWTLLFAVAALAWGYQRFVAKEHTQSPLVPLEDTVTCDSTLHFDISDSIANMRISRYMTRYVPKVQPFAATNCSTLNGGVQYFGIKKCEIQDMATAFSTSDSVNAFLCLIPGTGGAQDTLDLIFKVYTTSGAITHQYYDFTTPCPPCAVDF